MLVLRFLIRTVLTVGLTGFIFHEQLFIRPSVMSYTDRSFFKDPWWKIALPKLNYRLYFVLLPCTFSLERR